MAHTKEHEKELREKILGDRKDRVVGAYKTQSDAKRANKLEGGVESFDGGEFTLGSKRDPNDKRRQKAVARQNKKDARRERRAKRIGARKLMSDEQAQDFMRNRKDRFNTAFGNVLLDLTGNEDKKGVIKDRYYRKEGSGTIQNVAKLDDKGKPTGETYNATDPFQFSGTRMTPENEYKDKFDVYTNTIKPIPMDDLTVDINIPEVEYPDDPRKKQKKIIEDKTTEEIKKIVDPPKGPETLDPSAGESIRARNKMLNNKLLLGPTDNQADAKRYRRPGGTGTIISRLLNVLTPDAGTRTNSNRRRRK
tara:strand:+ start:42 stop:962 length:921 start_codon:yes stop_codon:yes gene_type:complete